MYSLRPTRGLIITLLAASQTIRTQAWSFSAVQNGQCGPLTVTWAGGKGPFTVSLHPFGGSATSLNIPSNATASGQGSYEMTLQVPKGKQFLVTMGDSDGPLTGGTSPILTAGDPRSNAQCNTTYRIPDFFWSANAGDNIRQCQTYPFTDIGSKPNATISRPANLLILIPNGNQSFSVKTFNADSFAWVATAKAGTQVVFDMNDDQGHQGGVGSPITVRSGDSSCNLQNGASNNSDSQKGSISKAAVAGIALGVGAFLGCLAFAAFLFLRKRRRRTSEKAALDLLGTDSNAGHVTVLPTGLQPEPFYGNQPQQQSQMSPNSYYPTKGRSSAQMRDNGIPSSSSHSPTGPHVVQHSDIADAPGSSTVELPPQYSDGRQPLQEFLPLSPESAASSSSDRRKS